MSNLIGSASVGAAQPQALTSTQLDDLKQFAADPTDDKKQQTNARDDISSSPKASEIAKYEGKLQELYDESKKGHGNTHAFREKQLDAFDLGEKLGLSKHDSLAAVEAARLRAVSAPPGAQKAADVAASDAEGDKRGTGMMSHLNDIGTAGFPK